MYYPQTCTMSHKDVMWKYMIDTTCAGTVCGSAIPNGYGGGRYVWWQPLLPQASRMYGLRPTYR